jgi:hypothetical protein
MAGRHWRTRALARAQQRPLFLYWGAVWCPPCNRVKSEIFARDEFVARGGRAVLPPRRRQRRRPGAGRAVPLRSYPTLVLLRRTAAKSRACRASSMASCSLPHSIPPGRACGRLHPPPPALRRPDGSRAERHEWLLLATSWDTDEGKLLGERALAPTLAALAAASANPDAAARLHLHAQLASGAGDAAAAGRAGRCAWRAPTWTSSTTAALA